MPPCFPGYRLITSAARWPITHHGQRGSRREHAFASHDRDAAAPPYLGHRLMVAAPRRLLEQHHVQLLEMARRPDRLLDRVAAVGIDRQPGVGADGVAH